MGSRDGFHRLSRDQQDKRDARIDELLAQGLQHTVIARRMGMSKGGLASVLQRKKKREYEQAL